MKNVLVFGTFDELHPGHKFFLCEAAKLGALNVVVALDETVLSIKGHLPNQDAHMRKRAVEKTFPNAHVILGDTKNYLVPLQTIRPDLIVFGYDQNLPPGISEDDLHCPTVRLPSFQPENFKSSLRRL